MIRAVVQARAMISFSLNGSYSLALPQEANKKTNLICHSQDQSVKGCWQSNLGVEWWKCSQQQQPESQVPWAWEEGSLPSGPLCSNLGWKRGLGIVGGGWVGRKKIYWRKGYEAANCCRLPPTKPTVVLKLVQEKTSSVSCSVSPDVSCIWDVTLFWVATAPHQPLWNKQISLRQDPVTALCPYWQPLLTASPPCAARPQYLCAVTQDHEGTSTAAPEAGFCKVITEHTLGNSHHWVVPYFAQICSQTPSQNKNQHFQLRKAEGQRAGRSCQRGGMVFNWKCRDTTQRSWWGSQEEPWWQKRQELKTHTILTLKYSLLSNHPWMEEGEGLRQLQGRSTETELKRSKYCWCNFQIQLCNWSTSHLRHVVRSQPKPTHVVHEVTRRSSAITSFCWSYLLLKHTTSCFLLAHKYEHFKSPTNTLLL